METFEIYLIALIFIPFALSPPLLVIYLIGFMRFLYIYLILFFIILFIYLSFIPELAIFEITLFLLLSVFLCLVPAELLYRLIYKKWFFKDKEYQSFYNITKGSHKYYSVIRYIYLAMLFVFIVNLIFGDTNYRSIKTIDTDIIFTIYVLIPLFVHRYTTGFWFNK